ncbi:hypothetical protein FOA52_001855 [Chlamydomonas sp. UWO 241]|nr:hypothetical protein FOA52_001855 [Chlamydomonas sp. UWO 241]
MTDDGPVVCEGKTPANVVIDQVLPYPETGSLPYVVLRNIGGQTADLSGWRLTDSNLSAGSGLKFVAVPQSFKNQGPCDGPGNWTIAPSRTLMIMPKTDGNKCGFPFELNFKDSINLVDKNGSAISTVKWDDPPQGISLNRLPNGTYVPINTTENVLDVLEALGDYDLLLEALEKTGLAAELAAPSDPNYTGPIGPPAEREKVVDPQFPWWFGFGIDRSKLPPPAPPPPPPPPPPPGVPPKGPYTILAPNDDAFIALRVALGGGTPLPKDQFFALPELKEILQYHILPGKVTTGDLYNNTGIYTAQGVEVTPFTDGCMTEGATRLHDSCIDKPTPDNFTCFEQKEFAKCYFPFMTSALAAQWQGGFCQKTCERCSCAEGSGMTCAEIVVPDVMASNGIIQGISRVMFPPPVFTKAMALNQTISAELAAALNSTEAVDVEQGNMTAAPGAMMAAPMPDDAAAAEPAVDASGGAR